MKINVGMAKFVEQILPKSVVLLLVFFLISNYFFHSKFVILLDTCRMKFLTDGNISSIITVSTVFIGFFSTILTIFATSQTEALQRVVSTKKVKPFLFFSKTALISSIVIMVYSLLLSVAIKNDVFLCSYLILFYYFLMVSLRFTYICVNMLSFSIEAINIFEEANERERLERIKRKKSE